MYTSTLQKNRIKGEKHNKEKKRLVIMISLNFNHYEKQCLNHRNCS